MSRATLLALALAACAPSIAPEAELDAAPGDAGASGPVVTTIGADGTATTRLDATDAAAWVYLDLDTGLGTTVDGGWELAAQRFHLMLDGGVSGDGGVEVVAVAGDLSTLTAVPAAGWITDAADGDDPDALPDYAFERGDGWYAYDPATHLLTPRPLAWAIRATTGGPWALVIDRYYDDAGTSGVFTVRWRPLGG